MYHAKSCKHRSFFMIEKELSDFTSLTNTLCRRKLRKIKKKNEIFAKLRDQTLLKYRKNRIKQICAFVIPEKFRLGFS